MRAFPIVVAALFVVGCSRAQPVEIEKASPLCKKIVAMLAEPSDWKFENEGSGRIRHKDGVVVVYGSGWTKLTNGDEWEFVEWASPSDESVIAHAAKPVFDAARKLDAADTYRDRRDKEHQGLLLIEAKQKRGVSQ